MTTFPSIDRFAEATTGIFSGSVPQVAFGSAPDAGQLFSAQQQFDSRVLGTPPAFFGQQYQPPDVLAQYEQEVERRGQIVDQLINNNRNALTPVERVIIQDKRGRPRLTISQINQLSDDALRAGMEPVDVNDERTSVIRFLDMIDLPRNTIANIAVGDPSIEGAIGGAAVSTALGATFGLLGSITLGTGALFGLAAFGLWAAGAGIVRALQDEPLLEESLSGLRMGSGGQKSVFMSDVLQELGVQNRVVRAVAGFAGDVLIDPLSLAGGTGNVIKISGASTAPFPMRFALSRPSNKLMDRAIVQFEKTGVVPDGPMGDILRPLLEVDTVGPFVSPKTMKIGHELHDLSNGTNRAFRIAEALDELRPRFLSGELSFKEFRRLASDAAIGATGANKTGLQQAIKMELGIWGSKSPVGGAVTPILEAKIRASQDALRLYGPRSSVQLGIPMIPFLSNRFPGMFGLTSFSGSIPIARLGQAGRLQKVLKPSHEEFKRFITAEIAKSGEEADVALRRMLGGVGNQPGRDLVHLTDTARQSARPFTKDDMRALGTEIGAGEGPRGAVYDDLFVDGDNFANHIDPEDIREWAKFEDSYGAWAAGVTPGEGRFYSTTVSLTDEAGTVIGNPLDVRVLEHAAVRTQQMTQTVVADAPSGFVSAEQSAGFARRLQGLFPDAERFALTTRDGPRFFNRDELLRHVGPPAVIPGEEPRIWMAMAGSSEDSARFLQNGPKTRMEELLNKSESAAAHEANTRISMAEAKELDELLAAREMPVDGAVYQARVYRGTNPGGSVDEGWYGKGTYYSIHRATAEQYAADYSGHFPERMSEGRMTLQRPRVVGSKEELFDDILGQDDSFMRAMDDVLGDGHELKTTQSNKARDLNSRRVRYELEQRGYDGVVVRSANNAGIEEVVAFHPRIAFSEDIKGASTLLPELPEGMQHLKRFMAIDHPSGGVAIRGAKIPLAAMTTTERDALMRAGWIPSDPKGLRVQEELQRKIDRWRVTDNAEQLEIVRQEKAMLANERELLGKQVEDLVNIEELPIVTEEGLGVLHNKGGLGQLQRRLNDIDRQNLSLDEMEEFLTEPEIMRAIEATDNLFGAHMRGEILDHYNGLAGLARKVLLAGKAGIGQQLEKAHAAKASLFYEKRFLTRPIQYALNKQIERIRNLDPTGMGIGSTEDVAEQILQIKNTLAMEGQETVEWMNAVNKGITDVVGQAEASVKVVLAANTDVLSARATQQVVNDRMASFGKHGKKGQQKMTRDQIIEVMGLLPATTKKRVLDTATGEIDATSPAAMKKFMTDVRPQHIEDAIDVDLLLKQNRLNQVKIMGRNPKPVHLTTPPVAAAFKNSDSASAFQTKAGEMIFIQFDETTRGGQIERMLYESKPLKKDAGKLAEARAEYAMAWLQRTTGLSRRKINTSRKELLIRIENEVTRGKIVPQDIKPKFTKLLNDLDLHGSARQDMRMSLLQSLARMVKDIQRGIPMRVPDGAGGFVFNPKLFRRTADSRHIFTGLTKAGKVAQAVTDLTKSPAGTDVVRATGKNANIEALLLGILDETSGAAKGMSIKNEGRSHFVDRGVWGLQQEKRLSIVPRERLMEGALFKLREPANETRKALNEWLGMADQARHQVNDIDDRVNSVRDAYNNALRMEELLLATTRKYDSEMAKLTNIIEGSHNPASGRREKGLIEQLPYRIVDKIARAQENFVKITRAGRRGTRVVEGVQQLRVEGENLLTFYRRTIFRNMEDTLGRLGKDMGGDFTPADIHSAVTIRMLEQYDAVSREVLSQPSVPKTLREAAEQSLDLSMAPLPDDEIWKIRDGLMADERTRAMLLSPEVEQVAANLAKNYTVFMIELVHRGLMNVDVNPTRMYLPLQLEDAARKAVNSRLEEMGQTMQRMSGVPRRASISQKFFLTRATNRMQLPKYAPDGTLLLGKNGKPVMTKVYTGQLGPGGSVAQSGGDIRLGDTTHDFERSREHIIKKAIEQDEDFLREYEKIQVERPTPLSGDLWDYHPRMEGAQEHGERWMPRQHMSSPHHLNKNRDAFTRLVGEDFTGPIFREDPMLAFGQRLEQQFISTSTDSFVKTMKPHIKSMDPEEFKLLQRVPGSSEARLINGVAYRTLNDAKVRDSKVRLPLPDPTPGSMQLWPDDVATEYENLAQILREEDVITNLGKAVDTVNSLFKTAVLFLPRWTIVNILGSSILAKMAGADLSTMVTEFRPLWKAVGAAHGMGALGKKSYNMEHLTKQFMTVGGTEYRLDEIIKEAILDRVINSGRVMQEILPALAAGDAGAKMITKMAQGKHMLAAPIGAWFKWNAALEDFMRMSTYVSLRNQGHARTEAASLVTKYLFDYGDLSLVEKKFGTRLWPFFRWMRNNIGLQVNQVLSKPKYAGAFPKLLNALTEATEDENSLPTSLRPRWIRDQMALSVVNNKQNAIFLNLNSLTPAQELFEIGQGLMGLEGFTNFLRFYTSATNPLVKGVIELATGQEMFTRFKIGDPKEGAAITLPEWAARQTGVLYELLNKIPQAGGFEPGPIPFVGNLKRKDDEPLTGGDVGALAGRFLIGGRVQSRDIDALVKTKRFEEGDRTQRLRFAIKRAVEKGDRKGAEDLALEYVDRMRTLWDIGMVDMVPKVLKARFRREDQATRAGRNPAVTGLL